MKIGYARVSTADQNPQMQADALAAAGAERIFTDTATGANIDRPELEHLFEILRSGDVVIVWRLDRLARSLRDLIDMAAKFESRGVQFVSLNENIDTTTAGGKLFFNIFGAIAEFERDLISERTKAGLAAARRQGRTGGRPPSLTKEKFDAAVTLLAKYPRGEQGRHLAAVAKAIGTSKRTMIRVHAGEYDRHFRGKGQVTSDK